MNALLAHAAVGKIHQRRQAIVGVLNHIWGNIDIPLEHYQSKCFAQTVVYHLQQMQLELTRLEKALEEPVEGLPVMAQERFHKDD